MLNLSLTNHTWCHNIHDMLLVTIPEVWPTIYSDRVKLVHATCNFNSEFGPGVNNIADVRITFPSLDSEGTCTYIQQYIQDRTQVDFANYMAYTDINDVQRYRLTIEYCTEIYYTMGMANGVAYAHDL